MRANAGHIVGSVVLVLMSIASVGNSYGDPESRAGGNGMKLNSDAFQAGGGVPSLYTCEGRDVSPPLVWSDVPQGAKSLVLIVDDPDAPDPRAPKRTWVHWVLYNLPATADRLPEGVKSGDLPAGTLEGLNDWKRTGYGGPCPPIGRHRYFHKLYALDSVLPDLGKPTKAMLEAQMAGKVVAEAVLIGTYEKVR